MTAKENVHSGHRERIVDKFVAHPDSPSDHELLEILLFSFIPRKNTNDIAHNLLNRFGSIEKVFACSPTELITVEGIGKKTAERIILELRDKIAGLDVTPSGAEQIIADDETDDAVVALMGLGFTRAESLQAVRKAKADGATTIQQTIAFALKSMR